MTGVVRKDVDSAGGKLIQGSNDVFVNNHSAVRKGDAVAGHGTGKHAGPVMAEGMPSVFVNNIPLCHAGHVATCSHPATGSSDVFTG